jgi:hypothetical protein
MKMQSKRLFNRFFGLRSFFDAAWARTESATVIANAVSGMALVAVPAVLTLLTSVSTYALSLALIVLFGPLIGFLCSSIYPRLECFSGRRLGGKASLDNLYRIFAWAFLPFTLALILFTVTAFFVARFTATPEAAMLIIASIPSLVICYWSLRRYCLNVIAVQQVTRARGAAGIALTFALALLMIIAAGGFFGLFFEYAMTDDLKAMLG